MEGGNVVVSLSERALGRVTAADVKNPITGEVIHYEPDVEEGDLILFPSFIHHYTTPNQTDTERIVLSFNLKCY